MNRAGSRAEERAPLLLLLILGLLIWGGTLPANLLRPADTPPREFTVAPAAPSLPLAPTAEQTPLPHLAIFTFDPISLNRADHRTLAFLPGIGPALAARIIEYRQTHGPFQSMEELRQVPGIGPKTLERLRPLATL